MKLFKSNVAYSTINKWMDTLHSVKHWDITEHMYNRMDERGYTLNHIQNIIDNGKFVEYHDERGTDRIVVEIREAKVRASIVADLTTKTLITLFVRDNDILGRNNKPYLGS